MVKCCIAKNNILLYSNGRKTYDRLKNIANEEIINKHFHALLYEQTKICYNSENLKKLTSENNVTVEHFYPRKIQCPR